MRQIDQIDWNSTRNYDSNKSGQFVKYASKAGENKMKWKMFVDCKKRIFSLVYVLTEKKQFGTDISQLEFQVVLEDNSSSITAISFSNTSIKFNIFSSFNFFLSKFFCVST